jgi:hypothetical protein
LTPRGAALSLWGAEVTGQHNARAILEDAP